MPNAHTKHYSYIMTHLYPTQSNTAETACQHLTTYDGVHCSKPCDAGVWPISEKPTMQGRWPVRGCFCSPGCVMRFLVSSRIPGADPAWRHNTARVIRARLKLPPQRAVPIAPPPMALRSHGGHMALEEWRTLAGYGGALPKYDEFTEYAPGALVYGYAATTRTTTLSESNKDDVAHQWRWIRHPVRVPDPEPQVERTSHRTVPPQMQASELTFDPVADRDDRAAAAATVVDGGGSGSGSAGVDSGAGSATAAAGTRKRPRPTEQLMQDRTDTLLLRALEAKRARTSGGRRGTATPDASGSTCVQDDGTNVGANCEWQCLGRRRRRRGAPIRVLPHVVAGSVLLQAPATGPICVVAVCAAVCVSVCECV